MWLAAGLLAAPPVATAVTALADQQPGLVSPETLVGTLITPVMVVVLFLTNQIYSRGHVKNLEAALKESQDREQAKDEQYSQSMERVIPALTLSTNVLNEVSPFIRSGVLLQLARAADTYPQTNSPPNPPPGAGGG